MPADPIIVKTAPCLPRPTKAVQLPLRTLLFPPTQVGTKTVAIAKSIHPTVKRAISPAPVPPCGRMLLNTFPSTYKTLNGSSSTEVRKHPRIFPPIQFKHLTFGQISQETSSMLPPGSVLPVYGACPDGWQRIAGSVPGARTPWIQSWNLLGNDQPLGQSNIARRFSVLSNGDLFYFSQYGYPCFVSGTTGVLTKGAYLSATVSYIYDVMSLSDDLFAVYAPPSASIYLYKRSTNTWTTYANASGTQYARGMFCAMTPTTNKFLYLYSSSYVIISGYGAVSIPNGEIAGLYAVSDTSVVVITATSSTIYAYSVNPANNQVTLLYSLAAASMVPANGMRVFSSNGRKFLYIASPGALFELTASGWVRFPDITPAGYISSQLPTSVTGIDLYASASVVRFVSHAHNFGSALNSTIAISTPNASTAWTTIFAGTSRACGFGPNGEFSFMNAQYYVQSWTPELGLSQASADAFNTVPHIIHATKHDALLFGGLNGSAVENMTRYLSPATGYWEVFQNTTANTGTSVTSNICHSFRFGKYAICFSNGLGFTINADAAINGLVTFARKL